MLSIRFYHGNIQRIIAASCLLFLMLLFPIWAGDDADGHEQHFRPGASLREGFRKVEESASLVLYVNSSSFTIAVEHRDSGFFWYSKIDAPQEFRAALGAQWQQRLLSLFEMEYGRQDDENVYFLAEKNARRDIEITDISGGVQFDVYLPELLIAFAIQVCLDDDSLTVTIPISSLREEGTARVITVTPLPYFGSAMNTETGYMVYPDGSGAVHEFKRDHPEFFQGFRGYVYGNPQIDLNIPDRGDAVMLPVFGVVKGENAFFGFLESGDTASRIQFSPSGFRVNVNRIAADFVFRHRYRVVRSNVAARTTTALTTVVDLLDSTLVDSDKTIRYVFLSEEQASYSGMAAAYREILLDRGKLVPAEGRQSYLSLDFLLGIEEPRILFNRYITMTTVDDVKNFTGRLAGMGVDYLGVNLLGWERSGYLSPPVTIPVSRNIGGRSGISALADYLAGYGWPLTLKTDITRADRDNRGFSIYRDVVKNPLGLVVTDSFSRKYFISPVKTLDWMTGRILPYFRNAPQVGFHIDMAGKILLLDRQEDRLFTRQDAVNTWHEIFDQIRRQDRYAAASGGGLYILSKAQRLYDIPMQDSGFLFSDYSIPFFQMVVHGSIPYSGLPGNLSWDHQWHVLKWIEYGYLPHYQLTAGDARELRKTAYSRLFNSSYSQWEQTVAAVYGRHSQVYPDAPGRFMEHHAQVYPGVFETRFTDGSRVLVNYNRHPVNIGSAAVEAMDFLYLDAQGARK